MRMCRPMPLSHRLLPKKCTCPDHANALLREIQGSPPNAHANMHARVRVYARAHAQANAVDVPTSDQLSFVFRSDFIVLLLINEVNVLYRMQQHAGQTHASFA